MLRFFLRRLLLVPPPLLGVAAVTFGLSRATGADPVVSIVGERQMDNAAVVAAARALGPGPPAAGAVRALRRERRTRRLRHQLPHAPAGRRRPRRAPSGLARAGAGGHGAGDDRGPGPARGAAARAFAALGVSLPGFLSGLLMLSLFATALGWLPGPGRLDPRLSPPREATGLLLVDAALAGEWAAWRDAARRLVLPAAALGWTVAAVVARLLRASLLEQMGRRYVTAARARGLPLRGLLLEHALPNALAPVIAVVGLSFATLVTGAVLTETVFAWPGVGSYALESVRALDHPAIMAVTMLGGAALVLSAAASDLVQAAVGPRVRLG